MTVKLYLKWLAQTLVGVISLAVSIAILSFAIGISFRVAVICYKFAYNLF